MYIVYQGQSFYYEYSIYISLNSYCKTQVYENKSAPPEMILTQYPYFGYIIYRVIQYLTRVQNYW